MSGSHHQPGDAATPPSRDEQAAMWCLELAEGTLELEGRQSFDRWMEDPANARAFDEAASVWGLSAHALNAEPLLHLRQDALNRFNPPARGVRRLRVVGAALAIVLFVWGVFVPAADTLSTDVGERRVTMLEDGSRVALDARTRVMVRLEDDVRHLEMLEGRALFEVSKDVDRPFEVRAGDHLVVATGTAFSVEIIEEEVRVVLYEGSVEVRALHRAAHALDTGRARPAPPLVLQPGYELTMPVTGLIREPMHRVDLERAAAWDDGQMVVDEERLELVAARMSRYSRTRLRMGDAKAAQLPISGVFNKGDMAALIEAVTALHPLTATQEEGAIVLRTKTALMM